MSNLRSTLEDLLGKLSEKNYDESFAQYCFWLKIGSAHGYVTSECQVRDSLWRIAPPDGLKNPELIHPTAHLLIRFIGDMEADQKFTKYTLGLHKRKCTSELHRFFEGNLSLVRSEDVYGSRTLSFLTGVNLIAHWANLGYVGEEIIRDQILQSLISHPKLHSFQRDALTILFKLAGATFVAYADPSVVSRCFELIRIHNSGVEVKKKLIQVCAPRIVRGAWHGAEPNFQEVVDLRDCGWEGLPPPPVFTTGKPNPTNSDPKDPAATPVVISLGLPSGGLESQILQPAQLEPDITPEMATIPGSPTPQSPSISIATLSDFTTADTTDDESPLDPTALTPHDTFYLEDGNVEVLCGNTLFRVNTSVLSFNSPVLSRMLAKANLASAESPNGCPRILSSDAAADFVTLLKVIYLPEYATLSCVNKLFC